MTAIHTLIQSNGTTLFKYQSRHVLRNNVSRCLPMARQYLKNNPVTYYVITHVGVYAEQWYVLPSASTLSGGEYLDFPIEGNSIKNDGLTDLLLHLPTRIKKIAIVSQVLFRG